MRRAYLCIFLSSMANFFLLPYLAVLCAASLPAPPPRTAIVRAGRSGATSVPRLPARGPLRSESTPNSLWPAPVSLVRAGNDSWAKLGDNVAAVGADCVYTQHGPGPLLACQRACESAGAQGCNVINYDAAIDDCVFRRCDDPAHPALTPADGYAVYALSRPALASYGLSPASFSFVVAGASSRTLTAALARYVNWTFAFGPGAAGAPADVAALRVNVLAAGDELEFGADESYELVVAPRNNSAPSTLTAATVWGALRGLETFAQLVSFDLGARTSSVQSAAVADAPRFPFRGVLLDTSRHFLSLSALKEVVEAMSWAKLNVLSLHLSDDQSWPLVVASAPLLALRSAFSNYSHVYTPAMIADLVDFAKLRGVRVLPELDSPSHFGSLFAAYPQYAAQAVDANNNSYLCMVDPSRDEVYAFLAGIWSDAAAMFPDLTFRVGGDELQGCWADSPAVLAWMKKEGLPNIDAAYYYYVRKLVGIMRGLSPPRNTIAWLDVAGFWANQSWAHDYSDVVLDVWTGCYSGSWQHDVADFTAQGGKVVVSGPFYITQQNGAPATPHFTWQQMYSTDLANFTGNTSAAIARVLGGELAVWDDAAQTDSADVMVSITPFILGVGEAWWSPQAATSGVTPDEGRLHDQRCRLVQRGLASHPVFAFGTACPMEYEVPRYA